MVMPWRRKPARHLRYWPAGFKTVLAFCMGLVEPPNGYHSRCHHNGRLELADLPDWDFVWSQRQHAALAG
jgi:hypothetical protein